MKRILAAVLVVSLTGCSAPARRDHTVSDTLPSQVLHLQDWSLTTPIADEETGALEIYQPDLLRYRASFFRAGNSGGVVFVTPANGAVQFGAEFPRTELREGATESTPEWSALKGTHVLSVAASIDAVPGIGKGAEVIGQVHALGPYILLIQLDGSLLYVKAGDRNIATLDAHYQLGTPFRYMFWVAGGTIYVYYNGLLAATWQTDCSKCFFKAGSYLQIPPAPASSREFGQTTIYSLEMRHFSSAA